MSDEANRAESATADALLARVEAAEAKALDHAMEAVAYSRQLDAIRDVLAPILQLEEKATPGPWWESPSESSRIVSDGGVGVATVEFDRSDLELIVAAINALPTLRSILASER